MPEKFISMIPFVLATTDGRLRLSTARIIEAILIALIAGGLSGFIAFKQLEVRVDELKKQSECNFQRTELTISRLDQRITDMQNRMLEGVWKVWSK